MTHHLHSFYLTVTEIISGAVGEVSALMFVTSKKRGGEKKEENHAFTLACMMAPWICACV